MVGFLLLVCVALATSMQTNNGNSLMVVYMNQGSKAAFDLIDLNKDGTISLNELEAYYERLSDNDLAINLREYILYTKMPHYMAAAEYVELDADKDGFLTRSDTVSLYHAYDENKDNMVTEKEFKDVYGALVIRVHRALIG